MACQVLEVMLEIPDMPFSIDFLSDGRLLVVSGREGRLFRREPDGSLVSHADLTGLSAHPWSDIVVDRRGDVYVKNIGCAREIRVAASTVADSNQPRCALR